MRKLVYIPLANQSIIFKVKFMSITHKRFILFCLCGSCLHAAKSPARGKLASAEKGEISKIYGVIYVPAEFFII